MPVVSQFSTRLLKCLSHLLYRKTILLLSVLFLAGMAGALWNMSQVSTNLIQSQALQNAALYAQAIQQARTLYSSEVVERLSTNKSVAVTHNYQLHPGAVPLPVNFLIKLSQELSQANPGMSVRLYSDYPFPWRQQESGVKDDFEREALQKLRQSPDRPFFRFEQAQGQAILRYAQADRMKQSCVKCHNTHPDSPKRDWQIGDVRGVLEIITPLNSFVARTRSGLKSLSFTLGSFSCLSLLGIAIVISRLRQTSQELELRVIERTSELRQINAQLAIEQEKSERLLLNILPQPIVQQLKAESSQIADGFSQVTVLFADIVNFTQLSEQLSPAELVLLLNDIFSEFDRLSEKYGLEKIKTIGDAYMVAGGIPLPHPNHAQAVADMALDMQRAIADFNQRHRQQCNIRIGINTGPVVAGVIGTKKFIYDLWGDTVNIASRMESQGLAGMIQVTLATYELLRENYTLTPRGLIFVKGKGEMATYFLIGKRAPIESQSLQSH